MRLLFCGRWLAEAAAQQISLADKPFALICGMGTVPQQTLGRRWAVALRGARWPVARVARTA